MTVELRSGAGLSSESDATGLHVQLVDGFSVRVDPREVPARPFARPKAANLVKLLARDPGREDAHRRLMQVFASQGSRARALRQYQLCEAALARESLASALELIERIGSPSGVAYTTSPIASGEIPGHLPVYRGDQEVSREAHGLVAETSARSSKAHRSLVVL